MHASATIAVKICRIMSFWSASANVICMLYFSTFASFLMASFTGTTKFILPQLWIALIH